MDFDLISTELEQKLKAFNTRLIGLFIRGSRARGDALEFSDYDYVALIDQTPGESFPPGFKFLKCSSEADRQRILAHPIRPLDLRDALIIHDPTKEIALLKERAKSELKDNNKNTARIKTLYLQAKQNLCQLKTASVKIRICYATALVLDATRSLLVRTSITPSGRRLLYQLFSLHPTSASDELRDLISETLGIKGITPRDAIELFQVTKELLAGYPQITGSKEFGRLLSPERQNYWQEGFDFLNPLDPIAAAWIPLTLLQFAIRFFYEKQPEILEKEKKRLAFINSPYNYQNFNPRYHAAKELLVRTKTFLFI